MFLGEIRYCKDWEVKNKVRCLKDISEKGNQGLRIEGWVSLQGPLNCCQRCQALRLLRWSGYQKKQSVMRSKELTYIYSKHDQISLKLLTYYYLVKGLFSLKPNNNVLIFYTSFHSCFLFCFRYGRVSTKTLSSKLISCHLLIIWI